MLEKLYELLPKNDLDFEYIINGILNLDLKIPIRINIVVKSPMPIRFSCS